MQENNKLKSISVFCGSSVGFDEIYGEKAYALGKFLALKNITLVYGGANRGLMRYLADGALDNNGKVIGVMPAFLKSKEVAYEKITELIIVETMHERKWKMSQLSDAVIAMPGGFGTLDEFFEMITWGQLVLHRKPVSLLNIKGYFDSLMDFADQMVREGFLKPENRALVITDDKIEALFEKLTNYKPPDSAKRITDKLLYEN
ncbi:MAG: TIGR00730 family Rossman fold protein [Calditrichaceae bacterium]|nr:TIGR00730 family Rossman fold protein [Calditrichaceae bacterium]RQV96703.1 MAG: TIGR00730 family Rossman fold protein [Calditrichota bacterium]